MTRTATLTFEGKTVELPVVEGAEHDRALDITQLRARTGLITFDPGFANTGACRSAVTYVDGEGGTLRYRGIPVEQLAERSTFTETAWLLIHGRLPTRDELEVFRGRLRAHAPLHESFKGHFEAFPVDAPPMAILSAMINTLDCFRPQVQDPDEEEFADEAALLVSKVRTIAAYSYRRSLGQPAVYPDPALSYAANVLHMMFSMPYQRFEPSPEAVKALNLVLLLHADHEQGCSTTTVRLVGSSRASLFASCAAGVCSLWGPVHGGASIAVMRMLEAVRDGAMTVEQAVARAKDKSDRFRLTGFGHRVYRHLDPRAALLKRAAESLLDAPGRADPLLDIARRLEDRALADPYFAERGLFPNADFYNGLVLRAAGIPTDMFTVLFAIGRIPGWIAHWKEQYDAGSRIARPRQVYTGPTERDYVPIDQRTAGGG